MTRPIRLAIVVSHPIQHFVPFYRALARDPELETRVIYASKIGLESYFDAEMNTTLSWAMDMLGGYDSVFLPEAERLTRGPAEKVDNPSVGRALADYGPDVVLIYGYRQRTGQRALLWARMNGVPAMMIGDSELKRPRSAPLRLVKQVLVRTALAQFGAFLTVGDNNEAYYRHYGVAPERLFRSPFTIDEETYRAARRDRAALRAQLRSAHGLTPEEPAALFVGKLSERKRPGDLLAAIARHTAGGGRPIRPLIAGDGPERAAMQAQDQALGTRAVFLGFVNVDDLPTAYAAADVLVHPSSADPHPLVTSEAACIGLPMILSDRVGAEGPTDIARSGRNARVYPCGDTEALAEALAGVLSDEGVLKTMSAASIEIFEALDTRLSVSGLKRAAAFCLERRR